MLSGERITRLDYLVLDRLGNRAFFTLRGRVWRECLAMELANIIGILRLRMPIRFAHRHASLRTTDGGPTEGGRGSLLLSSVGDAGEIKRLGPDVGR